MRPMAVFLALFLVLGGPQAGAQETLEVSSVEKGHVAQELEKEASSGKHDPKTRQFLNKIAGLFKGSKDSHEVDVTTQSEDCADCGKQKSRSFFSKIGRALGKGSAWVSTTTAKPFMTASAFVKGAVEKGDKNQDVVSLYQFFLNHHEEFDGLYLEAGTPEEMIELMVEKMEEIMEKKSRLIMRDFLQSLGVKRELPEDLSTFELTADEIAAIDASKLDPAFINNHPEYREVKGLIGEMTKEELNDIVTSGYFNKAISFENYKEAAPTIPELVGTVVGQLFIPKLALGVVSKTLAGLYASPVIAADLATGVSTAICLQKETQAKFEADRDLKVFCSYVTNKSGYELLKGRAKGYVAGKKFHEKIAGKIKRFKEKRAEKKRLEQFEKQKKKEEREKPVPEAA